MEDAHMSDDLFWDSPDDGDQPTERLDAPGPVPPSGTTVTTAAALARPWRTPAIAAGLAALVFGGAGVGVGAALEGGGSSSPSDQVAGFNVTPASSRTPLTPHSYAAIAAQVLPAVVSINVSGSNEQDTGSGIVLRSDGYVLTNNHVVAAAVGGGHVAVVFNNGQTSTARIVGTDQEDDLAVLKVARTGLTTARLGSSSAVRVGDSVLAVGSPLGLTGTVTAGIVSALNRPVDTTADQQQNSNPLDPFSGGSSAPATTTVISAIQTDAAINPGNSGGPLVDSSGSVIGINSAIASTGGSGSGQPGSIGVGFAIPIDQAKVIAAELIRTGHASHPLMGVSLADATDANGNELARVQQVRSGGPAATAGIHVGDVVVAVGNVPTAGADAVIAAIRSHQPGDRVPVTVSRGGVRKTFTVTLVDASTTQG
jgi:putative serine protease PepD